MISIYYKVNSHIEKTTEIGMLKSLKTLDIVWVDVFGWNAEEEKIIEENFSLQIMNAEESSEIEHSARFMDFEDHIIGNSNFIVREGLTLVPKTVSFTFAKNLMITSRDAELRSFEDTSKKIMGGNQKVDSLEIFLNIIDLRIGKDADLVEELTKEISDLSKNIFNEKKTSKLLILKLNTLRENLMLLMQNCIDKKLLISGLKKTAFMHRKTEPEFDLSVKDLESIVDIIRFNFDRLDYLDSTLHNLNTYEQNNIIKVFTVATLFFMPPTLISSIYGMNFHVMPELKWKLGYPFALALMLTTVIATSIFFKRKKWL